ncbi:FkbM family methyltransferase [Variovorax sp. CCNWLW235]|uniref:FkbM family methyltransferase n=1 Tax=Variovorax sp. CCNWLW235 TaxID=3127463 RepID=UPI0030778786
MLRDITPVRQLARLYRAILSAAESLATLSAHSQQPAPASAPAPTPAPAPVVQYFDARPRLDANEAEIRRLSTEVERLKTLTRHLRLQSASMDNRPFLIEGNVPGFEPFAFEIHRAGDAYISTELEATGIWEPLETSVITRLSRPGDFVLDIGGNIGWYSVLLSKVLGPAGQIITFEPDPRNFAMLSRNLERVRGGAIATPLQKAVSDAEGTLKLFLSPDNLGDHRIFSDGTERPTIEVPTATLDAILADASRLPDLVKSDAQGSEARIFRGAQGLFSKGWRPIFLMEFWPFGLTNSGDDPMWLWGQLAGMGYQMFELTEARSTLLSIDELRVRSEITDRLSPTSGSFINLVAIPSGSDRLTSIEDLVAR